jgi:outer membrane protein OmpA-like peptidoglycan-associated protein
LALAVAGCSHSIPKSDYPPTANAAEEIQKLDAEMNTLSQQGTDMLAPEHFENAREKLADAKKAQEKGKDNAKVLEELGYARAHYTMAVNAGQRGRELIPEVLTARNNAIRAGAPKLYPSEFRDADEDLRDMTSDIEDGKTSLSADDRNELQRKYMDVEVKAIKKNRLGQVEAKIEQAKKLDAEKYAPRSLEEAEAKHESAVAIIEASRTNEGAIEPAVAEAEERASTLLEATQIVADSKGKTTEQNALEIVAQRRQIAAQNQAIASTQAAADRTAAELAAAQQTNSNLKDKNASLSEEQRFNETLAEAQKMFTKDEAEVYRQGDQIVVRLKKMNFTTGKADLPQESLSTLAKVKDVAKMISAEKIVVEGHTDTVGSRAVNAKVSQNRAETVKEYLASEDLVSADSIEAKGFGFDKPIAPNKTKEGRAQNRRVDVIITPKQSASANQG